MNENYDINEVATNNDLEELLEYFKSKILETEAESERNGKLSQYIDGFDKVYKLMQADRNNEVEHDIKYAERDRKKCEYLESVARKTEEDKFKDRELNLKERELDIKECNVKADAHWWNNPIIPTALSCLTVFGVNYMAIKVNNSEFPIKNTVSQWMLRPNIKLPFGHN